MLLLDVVLGLAALPLILSISIAVIAVNVLRISIEHYSDMFKPLKWEVESTIVNSPSYFALLRFLALVAFLKHALTLNTP